MVFKYLTVFELVNWMCSRCEHKLHRMLSEVLLTKREKKKWEGERGHGERGGRRMRKEPCDQLIQK